jgi:hypothetical protein
LFLLWLRVGCFCSRRVPVFFAALGVVAALGFFGPWASCDVAVRGCPRTSFYCYTRPGRCARLGLFRRECKLNWQNRRNPPNPILRCARPGRCAWLLRTANKGRACTCQAVILRDGQSREWVLPWRKSWAITLLLMLRRKCACSKSVRATYHVSQLLPGAGAHVAVGHFAGLLSA